MSRGYRARRNKTRTETRRERVLSDLSPLLAIYTLTSQTIILYVAPCCRHIHGRRDSCIAVIGFAFLAGLLETQPEQRVPFTFPLSAGPAHRDGARASPGSHPAPGSPALVAHMRRCALVAYGICAGRRGVATISTI